MSEQRKTIHDIYDIAMAFITDSESDVNMQYTGFGTTYCIIRRGLADFPYKMEVSKFASNNSAIVLYRGTGFDMHNNRKLFKVILNSKTPNTRAKKNMVKFREIFYSTQKRMQNVLATKNNTEMLKNMLEKLSGKNK